MKEICSNIYIGRHVKNPLFLSDFNETWIFFTCCRNIFKYQIIWKSVHWEPRCSMRADGQTSKTTVELGNFANASKMGQYIE